MITIFMFLLIPTTNIEIVVLSGSYRVANRRCLLQHWVSQLSLEDRLEILPALVVVGILQLLLRCVRTQPEHVRRFKHKRQDSFQSANTWLFFLRFRWEYIYIFCANESSNRSIMSAPWMQFDCWQQYSLTNILPISKFEVCSWTLHIFCSKKWMHITNEISLNLLEWRLFWWCPT